jgi:4-amino-4-deoxy-L-arabinose transferase-like glycosyltransferase
MHICRQCHTLAVARNFHEECNNILEPRFDTRGQYTGIGGMEFPLVNYLIASGYRVFGFHHIIGRTVILAFSLLGLSFCFLFFKKLFNSDMAGIIGTFSLIFSPLFAYYSICVLPDVPSLSLLFGSLYFSLIWDNKQKDRYLIMSAVFLLFAGLIKISALIIAPYLFFMIIKNKKYFKGIYIIGAIFIIFCWYVYARHLSAVYHYTSNLLEPLLSFKIKTIIEVTKVLLIHHIPGLFINYAQFLFFLAGFLYLVRKSIIYKQQIHFIGLYTIPLVVYMVSFYSVLKNHDYYMIVSLPVFIIVVLTGIMEAFKSVSGKRYLLWFLVMLMLLIPVFGIGRILPRFNDRSYELEYMSNVLPKLLPDRKELVIVCQDEHCVYLYYFHRKGWSILEDVDVKYFKNMILWGAKYLISDCRKFENRGDIKPFVEKINQYGIFNIYKLKKIE